MKSNEPLGCGASSGLMSLIRPPHYKFWVNDCILHDELYSIGGTEEDRLKADRRLLNDMIKRSTSHYKDRKVVSLWWFLTLSFLYYGAVRMFGRFRFNYKKEGA